MTFTKINIVRKYNLRIYTKTFENYHLCSSVKFILKRCWFKAKKLASFEILMLHHSKFQIPTALGLKSVVSHTLRIHGFKF